MRSVSNVSYLVFHNPRFASKAKEDNESSYHFAYSPNERDHYQKSGHAWYLSDVLAGLQQQEGILKPGEAILELGCYTARNSIALARQFEQCQVYAVDLQQDVLNVAQQNADINGLSKRIHFQQHDFRSGNFPAEWGKPQFKVIFSVHTSGHLDETEFKQSLTQIVQDYLAPGGILIMTINDPIPGHISQNGEWAKRNNYCTHSQSFLEKQVFPDLKPLRSYWRFFQPGEKRIGEFPEQYTRWYVFQKPRDL